MRLCGIVLLCIFMWCFCVVFSLLVHFVLKTIWKSTARSSSTHPHHNAIYGTYKTRHSQGLSTPMEDSFSLCGADQESLFSTSTISELCSLIHDMLFFLGNLMQVNITTWKRSGNHGLWIRHVNPLHTKFFRGNKNTYLLYMSFLRIDMTQVVETLPRAIWELTYSI